MRSLHFTDTYLPRRDGIVTSVRTLTATLRAHGHHAITVAPAHRAQPAEGDVLPLSAVPAYGLAGLRLSSWLLRGQWAAGALARIAAARPDLIHVHTPGPTGLLGVFAARELRVPVVHTYHTDLHAYAEAYRVPAAALTTGLRLYARRLGVPPVRAGAGRRAAVDAVNEFMLRGAAAVILPTRAVSARLSLPVPAERLAVIPTGISPVPLDAAARGRFRASHRIGPAAPLVLYVGRVNREKGVDRLIAAFARVAAGRPDARLVLIGAMYERRWLTRLLRESGVADRIVLTGQQPPAVVAAAYRAADVFAFPSTTDTQALVLLEAAHNRLPVVMADPLLHAHGLLGDAALLTGPAPDELAAGIGALLDDPAAARALAGRAARRAANHTADGYARSVCALYRSLPFRDETFRLDKRATCRHARYSRRDGPSR
ncbi:glycosyltransferase [Actinoplanes aureus]|uniref:Glycosyltransferase n=1 Tax=Actinoplanes aureus TaxID=2792083 RepID=A0A931C5R3_9ACTN|nr:glycosyltransferase [Actinoplanes aureus]MBG0561531.1 glycosyltransferase [Actinoplanes aureus]